MNTFKRKALFAAVVAGLGTIGTAEAVFIAPTRTGQALVYPYYTVQNSGTNSWNTYISVVNTTPDAKAVKVRILEGRTSAEVLDFNLFLSPNDVWTAAIIPSSADDTSAGRIITADASCTAPIIPADGQPFRNTQYVAQAAGLGRDLARTREGYIEIIEMASLTGATADAVTHVNGVPDDCDAVRTNDTSVIVNVDGLPPSGGLTGTGTLINVNSGMDAGYKPDALDAFSDSILYTGPGSTSPALADATPPTSVVFNNGYNPGAAGGSIFATVYRSEFISPFTDLTDGAMATASVFMHESVLNEYVLDDGTASLTDWVVTQPIKNFFVSTATAFPPYSNVLTASGACEVVEFTYFDREERSATAGGIDFSPLPPAGPASSICWESTVLSIRNGSDHMPTDDAISGVLASRNTTSINITDTFQNGWASLRFAGVNATPASGIGLVADPVNSQAIGVGSDTYPVGAPIVAASATVFYGLPVTGFMVRTFSNGTLTCSTGSCQGNYASAFDHAYRNLILP
jgi:hypothetical protein